MAASITSLRCTGLNCAFLTEQGDTIMHSWQVLGKILTTPETHGILLDIGMPIKHKGVLYNCRILVQDGKILLIRPKLALANDGNYRELRYFTPWLKLREVEEHVLPRSIKAITGQTTVPIGDAVVATADTVIGVELCEELWTPQSPHIRMGLDGVEVFTNSSGSHHELRKLDRRVNVMRDAMTKLGGVYLYANQRGCDGDRLYYDGCAMIIVNGDVVAQGSQFSLEEVEVLTATIDLETVRAHRAWSSRSIQAAGATAYPRIRTDFELGSHAPADFVELEPTPVRPVRYHAPDEEIALGPACWMWDYLRRSRAAGFFVPLSGGIDSCATATIVYSMCRLVASAAAAGSASAPSLRSAHRRR